MFGGDDAVVQTNDDATLSKMSAVKMGYWKDDYIESMMGTKSSHPPRRTPEIHRGYFARVQAFDQLINQFLQAIQSRNDFESNQSDPYPQIKCQIVNLGCGFDTLYWRLHSGPFDSLITKFVDLDLPNVTCKKVRHVRSSSDLFGILGDQVKTDQFEIHSNQYHLVAADIRDLKQIEKAFFDKCTLDRSLPTLILSECVLVYVPGRDMQQFARFCSDQFRHVAIVDYCQVNLFDKFGQVMVDNLHYRGCDIKDLHACRNLDSLMYRFKNNGFFNTQALTMLTIYNNCLDPSEKDRIEKIEFLDEGNLLDELLHHYCIVIAYNGMDSIMQNSMGFNYEQ